METLKKSPWILPPRDMHPPWRRTPALLHGSSCETTHRYLMMLCSILSSGLWTRHFFCLNVFSSHQFPELCKIVFWAVLEGFWGYSIVCSAIQVRTPLWRSGCSLLGQAWLQFTTYSEPGVLLNGSHILSYIMLIVLLEEDDEGKPRLGMWVTCPRTQNLWMPESESDPVSGSKISLHGLVWCYKCLFICLPPSLDLQGVEQILWVFFFFPDFFYIEVFKILC